MSMKGAIVILNSGGHPMTVTDVIVGESITYCCAWITATGEAHYEDFPAECVHPAHEDPVYQLQVKIRDENIKTQLRQLEATTAQGLGLVKAMHKPNGNA